MDINDALGACGVLDDTLSDADIKSLDEGGFLRIDEALTPARAAAMRDRVEELARIEGDDAGIEVHKEEGTDRLGDLVNKDPMFDICFTHSKVLACVSHIIAGEFSMGALNARNALPGRGHQALHTDSSNPVAPGEYQFVNSIWFLVDFTEENGPTRIVPGSHRLGKFAEDMMDDPKDPHPDEIHLTGRAGTAYVMNAHAWHSGTQNNSNANRPAAFAFFGRRDLPQYINQRKYIRPETYERLSEAARYILDVQGTTEFSPPDFDRARASSEY